MNIDIFCDETLADLFTSKKNDKKYMLLEGVKFKKPAVDLLRWFNG